MKTIIYHHNHPTSVGTTNERLIVQVSAEALALLAPYLEAPAKYNTQYYQDTELYMCVDRIDHKVHAELRKFFTVKNVKNTERYLDVGTERTELPCVIVKSAIETVRLKKEKQLAEKKAEKERERIAEEEADRKKREHEAKIQAARELLANELSKMEKEIEMLRNSNKRMEEETNRTESDIREALIEEIIDDGYIERDEEVEVRYNVEKAEDC